MINIGHKVDYGDNAAGILTGKDFNLLVDNINKVIEENGDVPTQEDDEQFAKAIDGFVKKNIYKNIGTVNELTLIKHSRDTMGTLESYSEGVSFFFTVNDSNTGAVTVKINSLDVKPLRLPDGSELAAGDLVVGNAYYCAYINNVFNVFLINNTVTYSGDTNNAAPVGGDETQTYKVGEGVTDNEAIRNVDIDDVVDEVLQDGLDFIKFTSDNVDYKIQLINNEMKMSKMNGNTVVNSLTIRLKDGNSNYSQTMMFKKDGMYVGQNKINTMIDEKITTAYSDPNRQRVPGEYGVDGEGRLSIMLRDGGNNVSYELGGINGTTTVIGGIKVKKAVTQRWSTYILDMDDKLWVTGLNDWGQLGLGDNDNRDVFVDTGLTGKDISVGPSTMYLIGLDDKLYGCGKNDTNTLSYLNIYVKKVVSYFATIILDTDGKVWGRDFNLHGTLGLGDNDDRTYFTDTGMTAKDIAIGDFSAYLIDLDDDLWATGNNASGQLGVGSGADTINTWTKTNTKAKYIHNNYKVPVVIDLDDHVLLCGENYYGVIGSGNKNDYASFRDTGILGKHIHVDGYSGFIVDMDNKLWACGGNFRGLLGLGHQDEVLTWTDTGLLAKGGWVMGESSFYVDLNDNVYFTGQNRYGQVGINVSDYRVNFIPIGKKVNFDLIKATWENSMTYDMTVLVDESSYIWTTGNNETGELGLGDTVDRRIFTAPGVTV